MVIKRTETRMRTGPHAEQPCVVVCACAQHGAITPSRFTIDYKIRVFQMLVEVFEFYNLTNFVNLWIITVFG